MKLNLVLICLVQAAGWNTFVCQDAKYTYGYGEKGYLTPEEWSLQYPDCGGQKQSPINLDAAIAICGEGEGRPKAKLSGNFAGTLHNVYQSVRLDIPKSSVMSVVIGRVKHTPLQMHVHWGNRDCEGSEHTHDGKHYAMEAHLVNQNENGGLAVLGFFFVNGKWNRAFDSLVKGLDRIQTLGENTTVTINLAQLFAPAIKGPYFRYHGSLTTPPCSEIVTWTVYQDILQISEKQLDAFRSFAMTDNFRPVQPLNGRELYNSAC